jgi:putative hemolysin
MRPATRRLAPMLAALAIVAAVTGRAMADDPELYGNFVGSLPCADCSGVEEQLTLFQDDPAAQSGRYVMTDTYLGKSVAPHVEKGAWQAVRGSAKDPDARVFRLEPASGGQPHYYLVAGLDSLKPLDAERREIDAPVDMTLRRQVTGLANPASVNCIQQGGQLEIRHDAKGDVGVCHFTDGRQCEEWALFRDKTCVAPAK